MCVYVRLAVDASRCSASTNRYPKELRQEHSKCQSLLARRQRSSPRGKCDRPAAIRDGCAFTACDFEAPRVWIHIQDVRHRSLAVSLIRCLATLMIDGAEVSPQIVPVIQDGPLVDEIRYFKPSDRLGALAIIHALKPVLPRQWLRDLSAEYDQSVSVKHGHYDLWLAPGDRVKDH